MAVSSYCPANRGRNFIADIFNSNFRVTEVASNAGATLPCPYDDKVKQPQGLGVTHSFLWHIKYGLLAKSQVCFATRQQTQDLHDLFGLRNVNRAELQKKKNLRMKTVLIKLFMKSLLRAHRQPESPSSTALCD